MRRLPLAGLVLLRAVLATAALLASVAPGPAQDFVVAAPAGPGAAAGVFIERGLPPVSPGPVLEASFTRWFGLPALETRGAACGAGWRRVRVAAGCSQTGEPDLGWSAAGLACGVAGPEGGAGLRAVARRDRAIEPGSVAAVRLEARAGVEVGWGAWLEAARGLRLWASVPQSWTRGVAPPLDRPLEIGAVYERGQDGARDGFLLWLVRAAPSGGAAADHGAGAALRAGPLLAWAAARDRPLRGGCGLAATARQLLVAAEVESHPDLGETMRFSLGLVGRPAGAPRPALRAAAPDAAAERGR